MFGRPVRVCSKNQKRFSQNLDYFGTCTLSHDGSSFFSFQGAAVAYFYLNQLMGAKYGPGGRDDIIGYSFTAQHDQRL